VFAKHREDYYETFRLHQLSVLDPKEKTPMSIAGVSTSIRSETQVAGMHCPCS
jgi:hypothetical protein